MNDTRGRILDVATEVLGRNPEVSMSDVAAAAGVVRRTVYGYFPTRSDLVLALTRRAADEITAVLAEATAPDVAPDAAWADFIAHLWPLVHRYRVLIVLRRSEFGADIHAILRPVEQALANLVARGQETGAFGRHLPPDVLGQVAWSSVFSIADNDMSHGGLGAPAAMTTSLLMLGVPQPRAEALVELRL